MDYEADFQRAVRETVENLKSRQKKPLTLELSNGKSVTGWVVSSNSGEDVEERGSTARGQYWFRSTLAWQTRLLLREDGTFVEWRQEAFENTEGEKTLSKTTWSVPNSQLVGNKGEPFSEMKEEVQRLPYR